MKSRKFYLFTLILLCLIFQQGLVTAQMQTPTPEIIAVNNSPANSKVELDLIHPGDLIEVDVVGSVEYDWRGRLNPEGFLDGVDYAENPIFGLCRSEEEIASDVAKAYGKILREPKVVVKILDRSNRPNSIIYGAVKTPQRFQISRPVYLNELIIIAGGLTDEASGQIQIFRPKNLNCLQAQTRQEQVVANPDNREKFVAVSQDNGSMNINIRISDLLNGKKEANPPILSGDIVTVLEAESIYVIGGVANPKQISVRSQITLSRAVASAGGLTKNADRKLITIYRREAGETKIIEADLDKIQSGKSEDLMLRVFDIVEVAQSGRDKTKFPPVVRIADSDTRKSVNLPLRIID